MGIHLLTMKFVVFSLILFVCLTQVYGCSSNEWEPPGGGCASCPTSNYCNGTHSFPCPTVDNWGTHNEYPAVATADPYGQCNICPPGQFKNTNDVCIPCSVTDGLICYPCGTTNGTYCPIDSNEIPISNVAVSCPPGSFLNEPNVAECSLCAAGFISKIGESECTICPNGQYADTNSTCADCTYGFVCINGIESLCPDGQFSIDGINCGPCPDGQSWTDGACNDHIIYDICPYDINNPPTECKTICFKNPTLTQPQLCEIAPNNYDYDKKIPGWIQGFFWSGIILIFGFFMFV